MVRMPHGMRDRIAELAEKSGRSMNAEIVYRLQLTMEMADDILSADWDDPRAFALLGLKALKGEVASIAQVIEHMEQKLSEE